MSAWTAICPLDRLEPERGVAALLGPLQIAVFRTHDGTLHAIDNVDPICRAAVLSRGIVGNRGDVPTVASPMHKQVYDLLTGACLDAPDIAVRVYPVRCRDGMVEVAWVDADSAEADSVEVGRVEVSRVEPDPVGVDPLVVGPAGADPVGVGPDEVGPDGVGPDEVGPDEVGPDEVGPGGGPSVEGA